MQGYKDHSRSMTNLEFITELCRVTGEETEDIFIRGRRAGWLEAEDELDPEQDIARKQQARILHMYLLKEKKIPDLKDISKAYELKDLFDCRVCANHVAQVYCRGIMDAKNLMKNGRFLWFDLEGIDDDHAIRTHLSRLEDFLS